MTGDHLCTAHHLLIETRSRIQRRNRPCVRYIDLESLYPCLLTPLPLLQAHPDAFHKSGQYPLNCTIEPSETRHKNGETDLHGLLQGNIFVEPSDLLFFLHELLEQRIHVRRLASRFLVTGKSDDTSAGLSSGMQGRMFCSARKEIRLGIMPGLT